jgi:hypothetical protein
MILSSVTFGPREPRALTAPHAQRRNDLQLAAFDPRPTTDANRGVFWQLARERGSARALTHVEPLGGLERLNADMGQFLPLHLGVGLAATGAGLDEGRHAYCAAPCVAE